MSKQKLTQSQISPASWSSVLGTYICHDSRKSFDKHSFVQSLPRRGKTENLAEKKAWGKLDNLKQLGLLYLDTMKRTWMMADYHQNRSEKVPQIDERIDDLWRPSGP